MISIIICSIDAQKFAAVRAMYRAVLAGEKYEIIRVEGATSLADGYNRGFAASKGDIIIFSHDDIEVLSPDFPQRLKSHLETYDVVGVAGTSLLIDGYWTASGPPHFFGQVAHLSGKGEIAIQFFNAPRRVVGHIQALDGLFFAVRRPVLSRVSFDAATFDGFHLYDIDFTYSCHLAGFKLAVACDINLLHASSGNYGEEWKKYNALFRRKWFAKTPPLPFRRLMFGTLPVPSKASAVRAMTPAYWDWPIDPPRANG